MLYVFVVESDLVLAWFLSMRMSKGDKMTKRSGVHFKC